jgi:hypothetical protein
MMIPNVAAIKAQITAEFPKYQTKNKADVWWMRWLGHVMGARFMSEYVTTIGNTMYMPSNLASWDVGQHCALLRHEWTHMRQAKKLTFPLFAFLYVFAFLPVGLAYTRARFEYEAYSVQMEAWKEYGMDYSSDTQKAWLVSQFTGSAYLFMWPFPKTVGSWFDATIAKLNA